MSTVEEQIHAQEALEILWEDLGDTRRAVEADLDNPRLRRHLFHDFCVYNEASVASTKRTIVILDDLLRNGCFNSTNLDAITKLNELFDFQIEREVLSLLAGKQAEVKSNGQPKINRRSLSRLSDVRFAYTMFARAFRLNINLDYSSPRWSAFCEVVKRRNKITHPAFIKDLSISDADIDNLAKANEWFIDDIIPLMQAGTAQLEKICKITEDLQK